MRRNNETKASLSVLSIPQLYIEPFVPGFAVLGATVSIGDDTQNSSIVPYLMCILKHELSVSRSWPYVQDSGIFVPGTRGPQVLS